MKINGPDGRAGSVSESPGVRSGPGSKVSGSRPDSSATDYVQLSNLARLAAGYSSGGPSNVAKLSALSETVLSGSYEVDAGVVSSNIIEASMRLEGGRV